MTGVENSCNDWLYAVPKRGPLGNPQPAERNLFVRTGYENRLC